tara:strand:+ start:469 stop:597 length:129 start_codon:yes stop_codon:yes gene_type:complete
MSVLGARVAAEGSELYEAARRARALAGSCNRENKAATGMCRL